ncbi:hypothetical protein [Sandarakinorhabdus rubra]|uniref:hypothetical protein n=1 Tax=Sandarakinorhabdus rubra TaxID=2672568 RepID=UPI0013DB1AB0|nr:hypothetical protein [Sandarakinorhabdus rubra]
MSEEFVKRYKAGAGASINLESLPPEASEAKDIAMGQYMDSFGKLEFAIKIAIQEILQVDYKVMGSIFATLMTKQSIDLLEAVASERLNDEGQRKFKDICAKLSRRNRKRNHIVHGAWVQSVIIRDDSVTQEWVRTYQHIDPKLRNIPHDDPRVLGQYCFSIPELKRATDHVEQANRMLSELTAEINSYRAPTVG